jgi:uncharacterized protein (DUF4415 family)
MKNEYDFSKGTRGAIVRPGFNKVRISVQRDEDVIDWFRNQTNDANGGDYRTLINKALRDYMDLKS